MREEQIALIQGYRLIQAVANWLPCSEGDQIGLRNKAQLWLDGYAGLLQRQNQTQNPNNNGGRWVWRGSAGLNGGAKNGGKGANVSRERVRTVVAHRIRELRRKVPR